MVAVFALGHRQEWLARTAGQRVQPEPTTAQAIPVAWLVEAPFTFGIDRRRSPPVSR